MMIERTVYSVTDINRYVKAIISQDENLKFVYVKGEISNFKPGANGHFYFSLKDKDCCISVAMFNNYASKLIFTPKNGDEVIVLASVDVYPARGTYQLLAFEMNQVGQGAILVELEKLKKQLQSEGLFDASRKRDINIYPKAIGVITAKNSAAIKDIITNIKRRYPIADIYVFLSAVQGEAAPKELLAAFNKSQEYDLDTLIIGRGGGASEDLSAFNDEKLVRAIANSKMPVIAAVGHEIDTTLVDFVADKRASTPTGAAELATVDRREIEQHFQYCLDDMKEALQSRLENMKEDVESSKKDLLKSIQSRLENMKEDVESSKKDLLKSIQDVISDLKTKVESKKEQLEALNPKNILERGYSITTNKNGEIIKDISKINKGDQLITVIAKGKIIATVDETEEK